ncbi:restriction endonuclease [Dickeya parazeae]|uniref:restriction endonuclease n=1 Tax=Dickeya parazeae TaxID=2893572 RepID=UPI001AECAB4E|nr:restriction endonuclease [Dickeya parazeae]MBP2836921.1 restriction endonuclease [Dickeya parazeae]
MNFELFIKALENVSKEYSYNASSRGDSLIVLSREKTLLTVSLEFYEKGVHIYLYARTNSWDGDGDRTDMNDVFSTFPALFLRADIGISCTLFNIEHPMGQGENKAINSSEIYARYITFTQPYQDNLFSISEEAIKTIKFIFNSIFEYESNLFRFIEYDENIQPNYTYHGLNLHVWATTIIKCLGENITSEDITYNSRTNPTWYYFKSDSSRVSIIFSPKTANTFNHFINYKDNLRVFHDNEYVFVKTDNTFNALLKEEALIVRRIVDNLEDERSNIIHIPIENKLICISKYHIVTLECDCSLQKYNLAKNEIIKRRKKEQDFLFYKNTYIWAEKIDGDRFESFSRELLERNAGVIRVYNTSLTNEPDANADLICIWDTTNLASMPQHEGRSPIQRRKVVVQCKAWKKNIGKNDIPSIRDTLDRFDAQGMLVIVSKNITRSLFDHIEVLRRKGIWADFWDRDHIEKILDDNPDIISKYNDIVSFSI